MFAPLLSRLWPAALLLLAAIGVAAMLQADASGITWFGQRLPSVCLFQKLGSACPGCGTTRAGVLLLQGNFWQSLQLQPALPLFLGAAWYSWRHPSPTRRRTARGLALGGLLLATVHLFLNVS